MLADILFGAYRKKVLGQLLLHPESDYHVRELARLTGTAPGTKPTHASSASERTSIITAAPDCIHSWAVSGVTSPA